MTDPAVDFAAQRLYGSMRKLKDLPAWGELPEGVRELWRRAARDGWDGELIAPVPIRRLAAFLPFDSENPEGSGKLTKPPSESGEA